MVLLLAASAAAHTAAVHPVALGEDWCRVVNDVAAPGDIVELAPGRHAGGCTIVRGGIPEKNEPTTIRSADPDDRAVIEAVDGDPVVTVAATHVRMYNLSLDGLDRIGPLVRAEADNLIVDRCSFVGPAVGLDAPVDLVTLSVLNSTFDTARGWTIGCADGSCALADGVLRNNLVRDAPVEMTLGPTAAVFDNVVVAEGTAMTVRGGGRILRNATVGGGITLSGKGPFELESTVVWDAPVALAARDATGLTVSGVTLIGAVEAAEDAVFAAVAHDGPWDAPAGEAVVDCAAGGCFVDRTVADLRPVADGPLVGAEVGPAFDVCLGHHGAIGGIGEGADVPRWMGPEPLAVLCDPAFEPPAPPVDTGPSPHTGHTGDTGTPTPTTTTPKAPGPTGDTGTTPIDTGPTTVPDTAPPPASDTHVADTGTGGGRSGRAKGCGCGHGAGLGWGWLLVMGAAVRRRRARDRRLP